MLTAVEGITVGHWTDAVARTGCTVVVFPERTVASGEVRGGAPATREFALLSPERMVDHVDAVVLSGGSAFGLAAADGVVGWLEEQGRGFATRFGSVPIVVGMSLYDLGTGDPTVRPGAAHGRMAAEAAAPDAPQQGPLGAGTGCLTDKWQGLDDRVVPGGLGTAAQRHGEVVVACLVAVNAAGAVDAGATAEAITRGEARPAAAADHPFANTTIGIIATNARLDKGQCLLVAQSGHDGYARAITPAHLGTDGDAIVAAATGEVPAPVDWVRAIAASVTEAAVRSAVAPPGDR